MSRSFFVGVFPVVAASALLASVSLASPNDKLITGNSTNTASVEAGFDDAAREKDDPVKNAKIIATLQESLKHDENVPSIGNPNADVTVVEFFDYQCGHCKVFLPAVTDLVKEDPNVRVVFIEFPIVGQDSVTAAESALAINKLDKTKYFRYHQLLMVAYGTFTMNKVLEQVNLLGGIDKTAFLHAMEDPQLAKTIEANKQLAHSLNIHETPAIIIGNTVVHGMIDEDDLKARVAALRTKNRDKSGKS